MLESCSPALVVSLFDTLQNRRRDAETRNYPEGFRTFWSLRLRVSAARGSSSYIRFSVMYS